MSDMQRWMLQALWSSAGGSWPSCRQQTLLLPLLLLSQQVKRPGCWRCCRGHQNSRGRLLLLLLLLGLILPLLLVLLTPS
jgi:hypothetical protein